MPFIVERIPENTLLRTVSGKLANNGWKLIHHPVKMVIPESVVDTTIESFELSGSEQKWTIPETISIDNFSVYRDEVDAPSVKLSEGSGYTVNKAKREVTIPASGSTDNPVSISIFSPKSKMDDVCAVHIGEHYIVENNSKTEDKESKLFGIAQYGIVEFPFFYISENRPYLVPNPSKKGEFVIHDPSNIFREALQLYIEKPGFRRPALYTYMLDNYDMSGDINEVTEYKFAWSGDLKRACLDMEVFETNWKTESPASTSTVLQVKTVKAEHNQSPIVESDYRHPDLDKLVFDYTFNSYVKQGNYWSDSIITIKGQIDEGTAAFVMWGDTAPAYEGGVAPIIPIYIGDGEDLEGFEDDKTSHMDVIFGGTVPKVALNSVPSFDFDEAGKDKFYTPIMPLMKQLDDTIGNGLDNVIVRRNKNGARYVGHYISTSVPPNSMPPDRIHDENGYNYPRAWQQPGNTEYNYKFNPSAYTEDVMAGEAYLMHPEEGMRGLLRHIILSNPLSLLNEDTLRVTDDFCADPSTGEGYTDYKYYLVEGVSPVTKRPSIHYRPMGLAIEEGKATEDIHPIIQNSSGGHVIMYIDATGSMDSHIAKVKAQLPQVAEELAIRFATDGKAVKFSLVYFGDTTDASPTYVVKADNVNSILIDSYMSETVKLGAGTDTPESGLYTIRQTVESMVEPDEFTLMIYVTDALSKTTEDGIDVAYLQTILDSNGVKRLGILNPSESAEVVGLFNDTRNISDADYQFKSWVDSYFSPPV